VLFRDYRVGLAGFWKQRPGEAQSLQKASSELLGGDFDSGGSPHGMVELEPLPLPNGSEPSSGVNLQSIEDGWQIF